MTYLIVVNDVSHPAGATRASSIFEFLASRRIWIFSDRAPHLRRMTKGDKLIIYLAGGRQGVFVAHAEISSPLTPIEGHLRDDVNKLGLSWFSWVVGLKNIKRLKPHRPIREIIPRLRFIADKKNYGLSLRQGIRRLDATDVGVILEGSDRAKN